jgi:hypothetical protein
MVDGQFIRRNSGEGSAFMTLNLRAARSFDMGPARVEAAVEAFNVTNRRNAITRNGNFGPGAYPTQPLSSFGQVTAVGDPRTIQLVVRMRF